MLAENSDRDVDLAVGGQGSFDDFSLPARAQITFQNGVFHYLRAEYSNALHALKSASQLYEQFHDWVQVLECKTRILRILAERQDLKGLQELEADVVRIAESEDVTLAARSHSYYVIGICWHYREQHDVDTAMWNFERAIELAIASRESRPLAFAIYGKVATDLARWDFERLRLNLDRLTEILSACPIPELECSVHIVRSLMARRQEKYELSLREIWKALSHIKRNPNLVLYLNALLGLGTTYKLMGRNQESQLYLELAQSSVPELELPRIAKAIQQALNEVLAGKSNSESHLRFDLEKSKFWIGEREISFGSQLILRELLTLLLSDTTRGYSKAELVQFLWNEEYDPVRHDNRVYVTIRRLRRFIDLDRAASHIVREKNGYRFNPERLKKENA